MDKIYCAAIMDKDGKIWTGKRHNTILTNAFPKGSLRGCCQGFVVGCHRGHFVDRIEALEIATRAGQLIGEKHYPKAQLMSEDLY